MSSTDRIEKCLILKASPARVWRALTDSTEFGAWFGVRVEGPFTPGATVRGRITNPGYEHLTMELQIERMDEPSLFSYRWHPYAIDAGVDYSAEPSTLVEFRLHEVPEGTRLEIRESGFDRIPLSRRAEAYRMNDGGWTIQAENIARHVDEA